MLSFSKQAFCSLLLVLTLLPVKLMAAETHCLMRLDAVFTLKRNHAVVDSLEICGFYSDENNLRDYFVRRLGSTVLEFSVQLNPKGSNERFVIEPGSEFEASYFWEKIEELLDIAQGNGQKLRFEALVGADHDFESEDQLALGPAIRKRLVKQFGEAVIRKHPFNLIFFRRNDDDAKISLRMKPVSYTHLTLPTICSV